MGKKSKPKMPEMPDVTEMINAQADANRVDTNNLFGGTTYNKNQDGGWSQSQHYSPLAQALLKKQMGGLLSAPEEFHSSRPAAIEQMYAQAAAPFGASGNLPAPTLSGGKPTADVNNLLQQSLPKAAPKPLAPKGTPKPSIDWSVLNNLRM